MKKLLPITMFVLLAFAGCQRGPAMYEMAENPRDFVPHAEKFVKQVSKQSKHYNAEDWQNAVEQFVAMSKNYVEFGNKLSNEEQMRYDNARLQFMAAIATNGTEDLAAQVKKEYGKVMGMD